MNNKYKILIIFFICLFLNSKVQATTRLVGIENFPETYQAYLNEIAKKHPNWKFTALYTNLDWNYVISQENVFGKNLVPLNYSDNWKNTKSGQYNVEIDKGWVDSSRQAIEYCMDPRNFLNEIRIFQFEGLSYDEHTNSLSGIEKILYGTEFYQKQVSYLDSNGNTINMSENYSDLILKGSKTSGVSPYHLASRIKQEVGPFLSHSSISGTVTGFEGLYNFYNIGATSSTENLGAIKNGLQYAKDGKGASAEIKSKYLIPWNTKERAITGGAIFIGSSYINVGQNTIYFQKFDIGEFWHQYMTNVLAPYTESKSIYNGYNKSGILNTALSFIIPVYDNMPNIPTDNPNINKNNFIQDNTKVYCNATNVNIRTGPSTSYEVITTVTNSDKMTRIQKGSQENWDKVILENGIIGYIYKPYVTELLEVEIERIDLQMRNTTLQKGEKEKLQVTVTPEEASTQKLKYFSSNPGVASVDSQGNIQAISSGKVIITAEAENSVKSEIEISVYSKVTGILFDENQLYLEEGDNFKVNAYIEPNDATNNQIDYMSQNEQIATIDENGEIIAKSPGETIVVAIAKENEDIKAECKVTVLKRVEKFDINFGNLKLNGLEISGLNGNTVSDIKKEIITEYETEIFNSKNEILTDEELVGTGAKVRIKENEEILREYKIILYGDVNGDGKINSVDLLILQRHVLEIEKLEGIYVKAASVRKNDKSPSSVDLLLIQRHILGLQKLEQ